MTEQAYRAGLRALRKEYEQLVRTLDIARRQVKEYEQRARTLAVARRQAAVETLRIAEEMKQLDDLVQAKRQALA